MRIEIIDSTSQWYANSLKLRQKVLREPIGMNLYDDDLSMEKHQLHFVALDQSEVVGVVVMAIDGEIAKLRQMAVDTAYQGNGLGARLVKAFEIKAKEMGKKKIKLHARHYAVGFYEKLDYNKTKKPPFEEVGMEHFEMVKLL